MPFSVIIPVINSGGVTSNAGLKTLMPFGASNLLPIFINSFLFLSSMTTSFTLLVKSKVELGAAT